MRITHTLSRLASLLSLVLVILLLTDAWALAANENLDEAVARKARYGTNGWPTAQLEDPGNHYIWQPETLTYQDLTTGHEVWVLVHAPDIEEIYSKEHGTNVWSYDGSRVGFFSTQRPTANPAIAGTYRYRWIVNSDGSDLRTAEGYGRRDIPFDGFSWSHTENAYYAFGSGSGEGANSTVSRLFKNTVGAHNTVTGTLVLDTASVNTYKKEMVKDGVSSDDSWIVARDTATHDAGGCNVRTTREMYFIHLDGSPQVDHHWGIARGIGPSGDPYGDHIPSSEERWHDAWAPGPDPTYIVGDYSGTSSVFVAMARSGSCADGGPKWQDWNGSSFGNDEIKVISDGSGTPDNPYGTPYFGHPVFDRWGKYALAGTYTDTPKPGTRIYNMVTNALEPNYVLAYNKYDGQHHSWTGWTDYVVGVDPYTLFIMANKWNDSYQNAFQVADMHYPGYAGNYNSYPRPSESPDGTKVAFQSVWLNNSGDRYSYICWAVVYYPYPPVNLRGSKNGSLVHLTWERPSYTTRGWPDESTDPPPKAREIKGYHVWSSADGDTGWTELTADAVTSESYDAAQAPNTTMYYAVTSEEYSRLESRKLSEVLRVTLDANGNLTAALHAAQGKTGFWTTPPAPPTPSSVTVSAGGPYRLSWSEPNNSKIRYYNIYYSATGAPPVDRRYRIASVPVGTTSYLDWLADTSKPGYYTITSVDRQGNEGGSTQDPGPAAPGGLKYTQN